MGTDAFALARTRLAMDAFALARTRLAMDAFALAPTRLAMDAGEGEKSIMADWFEALSETHVDFVARTFGLQRDV